MALGQNKSWFLGIFTFVALFTGSTMLFSGELNDQPGAIHLSDLTDADIEMILAVKAEMKEAKIKAN